MIEKGEWKELRREMKKKNKAGEIRDECNRDSLFFSLEGKWSAALDDAAAGSGAALVLVFSAGAAVTPDVVTATVPGASPAAAAIACASAFIFTKILLLLTEEGSVGSRGRCVTRGTIDTNWRRF